MPTEPISRQTIRILEKKGRKAVEKKVSVLRELKVEYVSPTTIYPNAYNPNRQSEEDFSLLLRSMKEDGFTQPILVNRATKEIIDGEHRWRAAQQLGFTEIPVVFSDMGLEQARISTLRHNRARGSEDIELSIRILQDLRDLGALDQAMTSLNISEKELNILLADLPASEAHAAEEFSNSWVVDIEQTPSLAVIDVKKKTITASSQSVDRMQQIIATKADMQDSEEKRQVVLREDMTIKSIPVTFKPEQSALILQVLGEHTTHALIQLCRYYLDTHNIQRYQGNPEWNIPIKLKD